MPALQPPIAGESLISLADVAAGLPPGRDGRPVHRTTVFKWATRGTRLPDGSRLRLETVRVGGRFLTSKEALARFIARQSVAFGVAAPAGQCRGKRRAAAKSA